MSDEKPAGYQPYPRMLYRTEHEHRIVDHEDGEAEARQSGFVDYSELPKYDSKDRATAPGATVPNGLDGTVLMLGDRLVSSYTDQELRDHIKAVTGSARGLGILKRPALEQRALATINNAVA